MNQGDKITRIVQGAEVAAERAAKRAEAALFASEAAVKSVTAQIADVQASAHNAVESGQRALADFATALDMLVESPAKCEREKLNTAAKETHAFVDAKFAEMRATFDTTLADVRKVASEATEAIKNAAEVLRVATLGLDEQIRMARSAADEATKATHDCKASLGSVQDARKRLDEKATTEVVCVRKGGKVKHAAKPEPNADVPVDALCTV
jgi:hypothetical protein